MNKFENYLNLVSKVDDKFSEISQKASESFSCKKGCSSCCVSDLRVSAVEKDYIQNYFENNPDVLAKAKELETSDPHDGKRCKFLDKEGACIIYEARPIICRSHGAPIIVPDEKSENLDVCPLNFKGQNLEDLDHGLRININIINSILALVNMKDYPEKSSERYLLSVGEITKI